MSRHRPPRPAIAAVTPVVGSKVDRAPLRVKALPDWPGVQPALPDSVSVRPLPEASTALAPLPSLTGHDPAALGGLPAPRRGSWPAWPAPPWPQGLPAGTDGSTLDGPQGD